MIGQATLTLPQMLKEMDQAIGDELNEIKKNSQSKHTAVNGQLVSEQTKHYIYQFTLENPWDPQDDTPVKISFFGATEIKATIVTSTGFIITIATEELLPPEALNKVYLIDDPTELLVRLREALKNNKEDSTEIGSKCFALKPSTQLPAVPMRYLGEKFKPDDSQEKAIQMALRNETTYIIGPPGTGKTSTLAAIAYAFLRVGKSVLIAAHTNIAVDNAIMRLADICKYENFSLKEAPIIRYGTPQLEETFKNKYKEVYLPDIVKEHNRYLSEQLLGLRHKLDSYLMQLTKLDQEYKRQPDTWLQEKPNLLARQQQENNELQEIKAREEQRMANLKTQWNAFNTKKVEAEKELNGIIQKLNHLNSQQVQLTVAKGTSEAKAKELSHKLSIAQQTNAVMRMVKGMNKGTIEKDLTDSQYQLWQYNQQLSGIQKQMSEQYYQRSALEQQIQQYRTSSQTIEMQLPMPSNDRLRLEHLQKSLEEIKQRIVQEDARHKQEQANLDQQKRLLNDELTKIKEQMAGIEKQLSDIEKNIVDAAKVIGTTLSKVYMNSNQRERQFDVVIIDEVSMAPLPAVYIAASRANRAVITIGDPNQLPPICQSNSKIAKEWLGTDLFFKLNVSFVIAAKGLDHCVLLEQQSRMHPAISKIAREHVYNDWIKDSPRLNSTPYSQYSEVMPLPGKQLVLCDTGDASPNATQPEGGGRINIYHALCTIELARQALASLPEPEKELQPGEFRVGLIAPYRKQAQLLQSLVKDAGLEKVVRAGTVHKFQGLEAEVIIFDTVDSTGTEPTKFINGIHGSEAMKLINVAVTRAKHKLIIVSNLEYVTKKFPYGSILRLAVEEARKSGVVKSREIFGEKLLIAQKALTKYSPNISEILSPSENDYLELYNEHTFYDQFLQDVKSATTNIIILSPFLGVIRANSIAPTIGKKIKEGVKVVIITSQLKENIKTDEARKQLENVGAEIKIQSKMHEKLVFIDERIMYFGSLNALSYIDKTNTELMIRSVLPVTIKKFWDFMKIDNKLKSPGWSESSTIEQKEDRIFLSIWELPEIPNCKKCSRKMNPRIAKKTGDPFYGCEGFFSDIECDSKENVEEDHIKRIPYIKDKICDYCGSSVKITRIPYKGFWMECAKFPQCNYKRRIVFTKK